MAFRKFAFESHVDAYINAGIYKVGLLDIALIATTPDPPDAWSRLGVDQMKALMHAVSKNHNSRFIRTLAFAARGGIATGEKVITLLDNHLTERGKLRVKSFMTEVRKEMSLNTPARSRADLFVKWGFGLAKGVVKGIGRAARLPRGSVRPSA